MSRQLARALGDGLHTVYVQSRALHAVGAKIDGLRFRIARHQLEHVARTAGAQLAASARTEPQAGIAPDVTLGEQRSGQRRLARDPELFPARYHARESGV